MRHSGSGRTITLEAPLNPSASAMMSVMLAGFFGLRLPPGGEAFGGIMLPPTPAAMVWRLKRGCGGADRSRNDHYPSSPAACRQCTPMTALGQACEPPAVWRTTGTPGNCASRGLHAKGAGEPQLAPIRPSIADLCHGAAVFGRL